MRVRVQFLEEGLQVPHEDAILWFLDRYEWWARLAAFSHRLAMIR